MIYINVISADVKKRIKALRQKERHDRWDAKNLDKRNAQGRKRRAVNPERFNEQCRKHYHNNVQKEQERSRKRTREYPDRVRKSHHDCQYGIGAHDHYLTQIIEQKNCCAICTNPFVVTPDLDHDHQNNKLRGALCRRCNTAIGLFFENTNNLSRAIEYLKRWK